MDFEEWKTMGKVQMPGKSGSTISGIEREGRSESRRLSVERSMGQVGSDVEGLK